MSARLVSFGYAVAVLVAIGFVSMPASAGPASVVAKPVHASAIQPVDYKKRRWWWSNGADTHVRAPTTSVDTNDAYTDVDAPFTTVRKSPRGTWVRAPFVNLWIPR